MTGFEPRMPGVGSDRSINLFTATATQTGMFSVPCSNDQNKLKNGQLWALFVYFCLFKQTIQFLHQINVKNVMSIQCTIPGFEPSASRTTIPGLPK